MIFFNIFLVFALSFSIHANTYDSKEIVERNPEITKRFNFLKKITLKEKVTLALIGDYIHTDAFTSQIAVNKAEIPENFIDDDQNGYTDDFYGLDMNTGTGRLYTPVITGHENAIMSLLDAYIVENKLNKIKVLPINITAAENGFDDQFMRKLADAIDYARIRGAKVISMSVSVSSHYNSFFEFIDRDQKKSRAYYQSAIDRALVAGIIMVGSNSNDPARNLVKDPTLPANSTGVIAVANVNFPGVVQSAYGSNVDLAYYGTGIYVWSGESFGYNIVKGASFSTPLVALTAAVAKSLKPELSYNDIQLFRSSCEKSIRSAKNIASRCVFSPQMLIKRLVPSY